MPLSGTQGCCRFPTEAFGNDGVFTTQRLVLGFLKLAHVNTPIPILTLRRYTFYSSRTFPENAPIGRKFRALFGPSVKRVLRTISKNRYFYCLVLISAPCYIYLSAT